MRRIGAAPVLLLATAACLWCVPTCATVYRCSVDDKQVYTDQPCTAQAEPAALPPLRTMPAVPTDNERIKRYEERKAKANAKLAHSRKAWVAHHKAEREHRRAIRQALVEGRVAVGMTPAQVKSVLGPPAKRSGRDGHPRRWTYRNGRDRTVVKFSEGVVESIKSRKRRR